MNLIFLAICQSGLRAQRSTSSGGPIKVNPASKWNDQTGTASVTVSTDWPQLETLRRSGIATASTFNRGHRELTGLRITQRESPPQDRRYRCLGHGLRINDCAAERRRQMLKAPEKLNELLLGDFTDYTTEDGEKYFRLNQPKPLNYHPDIFTLLLT